jgi:hypothetical protein
MLDAFKLKASQGELVAHVITAEGGSAAITKVEGPGVAVTRDDTGDYVLTWDENPGKFIGAVYGLQAATPSALAGHTVVFDTFDTTTFALPLTVTNASDAAHDLAADEYVTVVAFFAQITV